MGNSEKVGGDDEFSGIFETDGGLEGEGVNDQRDNKSDPAGNPVSLFIKEWFG